MGKKARGGSPALDATILSLLVLIALFAVSIAMRVGPRTASTPKRPIRVELLNGSGRSGLAGAMASYLRDGGFDVMVVNNADRSDYRNTIVVDRKGEGDPAKTVAEYLGTRHVIEQLSSQEMIDVTVIVGRDARRWTQAP
ncbi:MAG: LytR C-terminal domain-containing protein [Hyphomicrobiales bacterium]